VRGRFAEYVARIGKTINNIFVGEFKRNVPFGDQNLCEK
jgi:hypothetical protein